ncbi:DUF1885 family protein [Paenibacillus thermoaerophilus]|uniref:DUF1885 family protein n=1 Tax=Paenibacillus thermoaerophilus TaxID=1215385 RepID=A0ABW2V2L3_9BACL|nr:DUF1885 family protein [Paenibacillus thermoaerophilus]TMV18764.1 DUF1885 family protein [Paenibacillus thermoaerophilus]
MSQSAFITFVDGSAVESLTLDELRGWLERYQEQTAKTGKQLGWDYKEAAFPYVVETKPEGEGRWFYLKGINHLYRYILFGVGKREVNGKERHHVQVTLHEDCTHGDKGKANEFCKYLAKQLKAELHLFNGRVLYYNPRK